LEFVSNPSEPVGFVGAAVPYIPVCGLQIEVAVPTISIHSPEQLAQTRKRRRLAILVAIVLALVYLANDGVSSWVDLLWFSSLGYSEVFWKSWGLQIACFVGFALLTFLILFSLLTSLRRAISADLPANQSLILGGNPVNISVESALRLLSFIVAFVAALITGIGMAANWSVFALFLYAPHGMSRVTDPVFGKPLEFFLFTLPAWQLVNGWLVTIAVISCILALLFRTLSESLRAHSPQRIADGTSLWRPLSITVAFLLFVAALHVYVDRFALSFDHQTVFDGVTYTDAHIMIPGLLIVVAALLLGAFLAAANAVRAPRGRKLALAVAPAIVSYALLSIVGWYVGSFIVKPNALARERPFIVNNIQFTRQAFGLDKFQQKEFPAEITVEAADAAHNQSTLQNIRLWDWHALQDTLRQVQEIRTYYDFPDIDIDRYSLNGSMREVMLAPRELNIDKLPESSRNWINEKLVYTHGYGVTMNPVNGFTPEGLPLFVLKDMPVQSTVPGINVTRPEIYFGGLTDSDVYVKTHQQEFNYPQGQNNNMTTYDGSGGIALGGFVRRAFIAFARNDLGKLPFSDDVNSQSRLLMRRNIRERVTRLAPFLSFDQDPYMVVGDDGRLSWIFDAFTTSDTYPDSTHYALDENSINYMRNSVKVVVDAYTGATTFYVFDQQDPILAAYRRMFPKLFVDAASMPADLRRHVRYSEQLFKLQSQVYGLYHMTDPQVFFNREDLWTVATQTGTDSDGQQTVQPMQPNYVLMKLPGEAKEEFVEILPFTPANRNNLIGWIAGRCDGASYGNSIVYDFPKNRLVDGPQQIEARIDQNAELSGQLTLWNQQGSHVVRGNLLVIPSGHALLYAEPIYLQAQQSPMPELRLVVLALQDKLAYGPTFEAALASLFGGQPSSLTVSDVATGSAASSSSSSEPTTAQPVTSQRSTGNPAASNGEDALIHEAGQEFDDYQRLTASGKLGEAGQRLDALKATLNKLKANQR
jgi:uncharacterized membrane protein (UPF0182 family)